MSSGEIAGSFMGLRGENCSFTYIDGVERLSTKKGVDLVHIAEGIHTQLAKFKDLFDDLSDRMDKLEAGGVATRDADTEVAAVDSTEAIEDLEERIAALERMPKAKKPKDIRLGELKDVDMAGITDRAILEWSEESKCFVAAPLEE